MIIVLQVGSKLATSAIVLKNVVKSYGTVRALDGVSFDVKKGDIFGFLGPNGAGKTTTIRCLMDFVHADKGTIKIAGLDSHRDAVKLKTKIGYLPADYYLYPNWSGDDHIGFISSLRSCKQDQPYAKILGLNTRNKVKNLSTGNRQKLAIVLALIGNPKILILDEPTRGLDPMLQNQIYDILRQFRANGGTIFMSSHNLAEVEKVCDSIAVIQEGKLVVEETLLSLRDKSIHTVNVIFSRPVRAKEFEQGTIKVISSTPHSVSLRVQGDIGPVIHLLGRYHIKDIEVAHASLEELFLELYK